MERLQLFHVLACRVCHKALRADAVERDLEQRVGAHGQDRQDHAPAKCLVLHHLPGREADLRGRLRLRVDGIVLLRLRARGDLRKVIILVAVDADAAKRAVLPGGLLRIAGLRRAGAPKPSYSQQPTRQYGSFGRVSIYGDEYNDFSQIPTRPKPQKDYSVHTQPKPAPKVSFAAGEMVQHKAFGRGMILTVLPMGADALLEIAFDGVGTKRLMANTASQHMKKL